jgi:hypothetical protein
MYVTAKGMNEDLKLTGSRQLEREGKEEKGHWNREDEDTKARCTQILERFPDRRTQGSQRPQQVMRWSLGSE